MSECTNNISPVDCLRVEYWSGSRILERQASGLVSSTKTQCIYNIYYMHMHLTFFVLCKSFEVTPKERGS